MYALSLILFVLLLFSLFFLVFKKGRLALWAQIFRFAVIIFGLAFFSWWFFERSISKFYKDALAVQIINKLPQTLDFYVIKVNGPRGEPYTTTHIGKIRPEYYRLDYLAMQNSDQLWVSGYIGKRQVYFAQFAIPNKNYDQIIEVQNYINQSTRLSQIADTQIRALATSQIGAGVIVTLDFLLLFLSTIFLLRRMLMCCLADKHLR